MHARAHRPRMYIYDDVQWIPRSMIDQRNTILQVVWNFLQSKNKTVNLFLYIYIRGKFFEKLDNSLVNSFHFGLKIEEIVNWKHKFHPSYATWIAFTPWALISLVNFFEANFLFLKNLSKDRFQKFRKFFQKTINKKGGENE